MLQQVSNLLLKHLSQLLLEQFLGEFVEFGEPRSLVDLEIDDHLNPRRSLLTTFDLVAEARNSVCLGMCWNECMLEA